MGNANSADNRSHGGSRHGTTQRQRQYHAMDEEQEADPPPQPNNTNGHKHEASGCTRPEGQILFIATGILFIYCCVLTLRLGYVDSLWHGYDSFGNICGRDNKHLSSRVESDNFNKNIGLDLTNRPYLFTFPGDAYKKYVRSERRWQLAKPLQLCVKHCPESGGTVSHALKDGLCLHPLSVLPGQSSGPYSANEAEYVAGIGHWLDSTTVETPTIGNETNTTVTSHGCPLTYNRTVTLAHRCYDTSVQSAQEDGWWLELLEDLQTSWSVFLAGIGCSIGLALIFFVLLACWNSRVLIHMSYVLSLAALISAAVLAYFRSNEDASDAVIPTSDIYFYTCVGFSAISGFILLLAARLVYCSKRCWPFIVEACEIIRARFSITVYAVAFGAKFLCALTLVIVSLLYFYAGNVTEPIASTYPPRYTYVFDSKVLKYTCPSIQAFMALWIFYIIDILRKCIICRITSEEHCQKVNHYNDDESSCCCRYSIMPLWYRAFGCVPLFTGAVLSMASFPFRAFAWLWSRRKLNNVFARGRLFVRLGVTSSSSLDLRFSEWSQNLDTVVEMQDVVSKALECGELLVPVCSCFLSAIAWVGVTLYCQYFLPELRHPCIAALTIATIVFLYSCLCFSCLLDVIDSVVILFCHEVSVNAAVVCQLRSLEETLDTPRLKMSSRLRNVLWLRLRADTQSAVVPPANRSSISPRGVHLVLRNPRNNESLRNSVNSSMLDETDVDDLGLIDNDELNNESPHDPSLLPGYENVVLNGYENVNISNAGNRNSSNNSRHEYNEPQRSAQTLQPQVRQSGDFGFGGADQVQSPPDYMEPVPLHGGNERILWTEPPSEPAPPPRPSRPSATCVVCLEKLPNQLLLPCKHLCICEECIETFRSAGSRQCPLCRKEVTTVQRIFLP
eukprot:m.279468 g.279468  ORF g.279468 m.279468 type:complete len:902 (+) comp16323_c10_seq1:366-3071(+)